MKRINKLLSPINGIRGAISLFMAVLMTPFLTIAMLLVETGRYNSAVSVLDEALGVSSVSTLANYDEYLHSRWGLLAVSQQKDLSKMYEEYLSVNSEIMGDSISVDKVEVEGLYSLWDADVLKYQILEYSKLNAPAKLINNFGNFDVLIKQLEKIGNFDQIANIFTSGAKIMDSGITIVEKAMDLKEQAEKLDELNKEYTEKFQDFKGDVDSLIDTLIRIRQLEYEIPQLQASLQTLRAELAILQSAASNSSDSDSEDGPDYGQLISDKQDEISATERALRSAENELERKRKSIDSLRKAAGNAKDNYFEHLQECADVLEKYKTTMQDVLVELSGIIESCTSALESSLQISTNVSQKKKQESEIKEELKLKEEADFDESGSYATGKDYLISVEREVAELETELAVVTATNAGVKTIADGLTTTFENYSDALVGEYISGLRALSKKVSAFNVDVITADSARVTAGEYKNALLAGYVAAKDIDKFLEEQEKKLKEGSLGALLDSLKSIYNSLMGLNLFFEDKLNANILTSGLKSVTPGNKLFDIVTSVCNMMTSLMQMAVDFATFDLLGFLKAGKNFFESLANVFTSLGDILINLVSMFAGDRLLYTTYATFNLPCRTDCSGTGNGGISMKTMTGTTVSTRVSQSSGSLPPVKQTFNVPAFGEIGALVQTINTRKNGGGSDPAFCGAELEYMLYGSNSEMVNQLVTFLSLYLVRLLCSIPTIMADPEVQGLAASATLGYPVVIALFVILEPLVQTILLTNGAAQKFIPSDVYLSPSGIPSLLNDLFDFCHIPNSVSESIESAMVTAVSKSEEDYAYNKEMKEYQNEMKERAKGKTKAKPIGNVQRQLKSEGQQAWEKYKKSFFTFEYREYCYLLLSLTVNEPEFLNRLANLIETETKYYYSTCEADKSHGFTLSHAYTNISVSVNANINQMLPSLLSADIFRISRENYRGY